jgi:hypothetical protein
VPHLPGTISGFEWGECGSIHGEFQRLPTNAEMELMRNYLESLLSDKINW